MTRADQVDRVSVTHALGRYDILIGESLLDVTGSELAQRFPGARAAIVSDETVANLHLDQLESTLRRHGIETRATEIVAPGEASKSFAVLERLCSALLDTRIERNDLVLALGGGVVGDLAGFAASILRRGVSVIQVPTSLLAQVDSSVGGKTGIDTRHGKNLIGSFHQPSLVIADTALLDTLSDRHFRAGYAEVAKYGLIRDAEFFAWLEGSWRDVFAGGPARQHAIVTSCRMKAEIVARDEKEAGERALLNLGHTFGHAFEAATGYGERLVHGEAIAIGMVLAFRYSEQTGLCAPALADRVARHFETVGLPVRISQIPGDLPDANGLLELIAQDKKVERGALTFVLAEAIGAATVVKDVPADTMRTFLAAEFDRP